MTVKKARLFVIWLLVLLLGCGAGLSEEAQGTGGGKQQSDPGKHRYEGDGFVTPEAAVLCYLDGLRRHDLDQMLSAFAWETQAERYSVEESALMRHTYDPSARPRMPALNDFMSDANLYSLLGVEIGLIHQSLEMYILGEDAYQYTPVMSIRLPDEDAVNAFYRKFDNGRLEALGALSSPRFLSPDEVTGGKYTSPGSQKTLAALTAVYGADELTEVPVLADVGDETFFCALRAARYGNRWYLVSVNSLVDSILGIEVDQRAFIVMKALPDDFPDCRTYTVNEAEWADDGFESGQPEEIVCPVCGAVFPAGTDAAFCGACGAPVQKHGREKTHFEGNGFDTPEAAVACYLDGLKNLDYEQMLSAFAWETQMEHYSVQRSASRFQSYFSPMIPRMPMSNDFLSGLNLYSVRSYQTNRIYQSLESFILGDDRPDGYLIPLSGEEEVGVFFRKFDSGRLETLSSMAGIRFPDPDAVTGGKYSDPGVQKTLAVLKDIYGADELVEVPVLADLGDEIFFCAPQVARYGNRWYLVSVCGQVDALLNLDLNVQAFVVMKELPEGFTLD